MTTNLMNYASALENVDQCSMPPVETWNPEYCGELDLIIRRDGLWIHEGTPITRARLVRLFSTVIRKEGERYYLVTPAEKLGIQVEDAPFVAVLMRREEFQGVQKLIFTTNVGDEIAAGRGHELSYRISPGSVDKAPYIHVRAGLDALIARAVFYDLVALSETRDIDGENWFGVASGGEFFPFAVAEEIFGVDRGKR